MEFSVGKILRNKITKQQGRIVRVTDYDGKGCCIVFITRDPARRAALGPEALWQAEEVESVSPLLEWRSHDGAAAVAGVGGFDREALVEMDTAS
jgi:hypothetical protein